MMLKEEGRRKKEEGRGLQDVDSGKAAAPTQNGKTHIRSGY
jgi:hypothetical protein